MIEESSQERFLWMIGEWSKLSILLDMKLFQMIWSFLKWWLLVDYCQIHWKHNQWYEYLNTSFEMRQSNSEQKLQAIEHIQKMMYISASQHYWIDIRILFCQSNWWAYYTTKKRLYSAIQGIQRMLQHIQKSELCLLVMFSQWTQKIDLNELHYWKQERCIQTKKFEYETKS